MSDESKIHVSTGFGGGISVNLRANSAAELEQLVADASTNSPTLKRLMDQTGITTATFEGAVATVQAAIPAAQPVSTVGQPLPQPVAQPVAQPTAPAAPPTVANPGPCAHGPRVYKDTKARGAQWRRWECALPWVKGNDAHNATRCAPVNVDS
jgi:hypothetical protein